MIVKDNVGGANTQVPHHRGIIIQGGSTRRPAHAVSSSL